MKKIFAFLLGFAVLFSVSCEKNPDEGDIISATYDPSTTTFIITYSSGTEKTVPAILDNSVSPPTASATLPDGTELWVAHAKQGGNVSFTRKETANYVNNWIYENMNIYYLWNDKIPKNPDYSRNPHAFFNSILYKYSASNRDGDRFSWVQENYVDLLNSLSGVNSDEIGFEYILFQVDESGTLYAGVLYPKKGSDAYAKGISRGMFVIQVNGQDITLQNYQTLFGGTGTKTLRMADYVLNTNDNKYYLKDVGDFTIQMHRQFAENPVYLDSVYTVGDKKVGYLVYHFFATDKNDNGHEYDRQLMDALGRIQAKGAKDMVLDLRYNSGGAVTSAIALASALVKDRSTDKLFGSTEYNSLVHEELLKEEGADYNKEYFIDKIQINQNSSIPIPALNLSRLYVLTKNWTASASELIINGLRPYMDVILIGETTHGKNVGSITIYEKQDAKNKWGIQPIIVKFYNSNGESDYTTGFPPNHEVDEFDADGDGENEIFLHDFGDSNDPLLRKALSLISTGIRSATSKPVISPAFRSAEIDEKATLKTRGIHRFELYDDTHEEAIRNILKK
ncbi:MAG TPA: peptidase S41 [Porphyromonadaceae bacterium]|jgi:C-terminal processing protease CtpA/Prc|nr:peptidase S41 [Porphyromonadaceae bacterium]HBX20628.1 peptidase S41 [Porphyromonadaceae bacterium]